jgi:predicted acetyltransferase
MRVEVVPAEVGDKGVVRRLMELYQYDFSEIVRGDVDVHGEFGYRYLDHYWTEADRHPFLFRVDGKWAGFAMVRGGDPNLMSEFFVMRTYRREGIGRTTARTLFRMFPGPWLVHEVPGNDAAVAFWRDAIPHGFEESSDVLGTTQRFTA